MSVFMQSAARATLTYVAYVDISKQRQRIKVET